MATNKSNFIALLVPAALLLALVLAVNSLFFPGQLSRQDKVNRLVDAPGYWCDADTVLLGSSRAKYVGDLAWGDHKVLNFANDDMSPSEYRGYIDFFKQQCDKAPAHILISADFFAFSANRFMTPDAPSFYIDRAHKRLQRSTSWSNFFRVLKDEGRQFGGYKQLFAPIPVAKNVLQATALPPVSLDFIGFEHNHYYHSVYGRYELSSETLAQLQALKAENPDSEFHVWVTPTSALLLALRQEFGLQRPFEQFLETLVRVFGSVDNYMWLSELSSNKDNFWDENHMQLPLQAQVVGRALGATVPELDAVAVTVDKSNLAAHLAKQGDRVERYANSAVKKTVQTSLAEISLSGPEVIEWQILGTAQAATANLELSDKISFCLVALDAAGQRLQGSCYRHVSRVANLAIPPAGGVIRLLLTNSVGDTVTARWSQSNSQP